MNRDMTADQLQNMFIRNAFVVLLATSVLFGCSNNDSNNDSVAEAESEECLYLSEGGPEVSIAYQFQLISAGCKKECWYFYDYDYEDQGKLIDTLLKQRYAKSEQEMQDYWDDKGLEIIEEIKAENPLIKEVLEYMEIRYNEEEIIEGFSIYVL